MKKTLKITLKIALKAIRQIWFLSIFYFVFMLALEAVKINDGMVYMTPIDALLNLDPYYALVKYQGIFACLIFALFSGVMYLILGYVADLFKNDKNDKNN
jgi:hypothetical protein